MDTGSKLKSLDVPQAEFASVFMRNLVTEESTPMGILERASPNHNPVIESCSNSPVRAGLTAPEDGGRSSLRKVLCSLTSDDSDVESYSQDYRGQ